MEQAGDIGCCEVAAAAVHGGMLDNCAACTRMEGILRRTAKLGISRQAEAFNQEGPVAR